MVRVKYVDTTPRKTSPKKPRRTTLDTSDDSDPSFKSAVDAEVTKPFDSDSENPEVSDNEVSIVSIEDEGNDDVQVSSSNDHTHKKGRTVTVSIPKLSLNLSKSKGSDDKSPSTTTPTKRKTDDSSDDEDLIEEITPQKVTKSSVMKTPDGKSKGDDSDAESISGVKNLNLTTRSGRKVKLTKKTSSSEDDEEDEENSESDYAKKNKKKSVNKKVTKKTKGGKPRGRPKKISIESESDEEENTSDSTYVASNSTRSGRTVKKVSQFQIKTPLRSKGPREESDSEEDSNSNKRNGRNNKRKHSSTSTERKGKSKSTGASAKDKKSNKNDSSSSSDDDSETDSEDDEPYGKRLKTRSSPRKSTPAKPTTRSGNAAAEKTPTKSVASKEKPLEKPVTSNGAGAARGIRQGPPVAPYSSPAKARGGPSQTITIDQDEEYIDLQKLYLTKQIELLDHDIYLRKLDALKKERDLKVTNSPFTVEFL